MRPFEIAAQQIPKVGQKRNGPLESSPLCFGAGNRGRTCTEYYLNMALNHARLPIPPPRQVLEGKF